MKTLVQQLFNTNIVSPIIDKALLIFRVLVGVALLKAHGLPKLLDIEGTLNHIPDPLGFGTTFSTYYAVFANVFCAVLIMLGLFTRIASGFILTLTLSGLFLVHFNDAAKLQDGPIIYSTVFLFLLIAGPGKLALDTKIEKLIKK